MTETLLLKGTGVNASDKEGATPLHYASKNGQEEMIKLLLKWHAILDKKSSNGETLLNYVSTNRKNGTAELLRKYGTKK